MPEWIALAQGGTQSMLLRDLLMPFALILGIWWFLIIRPQRQQEKRHRAMLDALKVGDKVATTGGIYGIIAQVGDRTVKLKVADNVKIEVLRSAIAGAQKEGPAAPDERPKEGERS
jgi:preprotein translocase subunit YajC